MFEINDKFRSWKKKQYLKQVKRDKKAQHLTEDQMYK